jgi:hypothetical protein
VDNTPEYEDEKNDGAETGDGHATEAFVEHQSPAGRRPD